MQFHAKQARIPSLGPPIEPETREFAFTAVLPDSGISFVTSAPSQMSVV